jgi:hypothetical protein
VQFQRNGKVSTVAFTFDVPPFTGR